MFLQKGGDPAADSPTATLFAYSIITNGADYIFILINLDLTGCEDPIKIENLYRESVNT